MITIIDWIFLIPATIFALVNSFLLHELCHVKSQGFGMTGRIDIEKFGFTCTPDYVHNEKWLYYSGGLLSGLIFLLMGGMLWYYGIWSFYVPFITLGVINFAYGIWEGIKGSEGRWKIYGLITIVMMIWWGLHYYLE